MAMAAFSSSYAIIILIITIPWAICRLTVEASSSSLNQGSIQFDFDRFSLSDASSFTFAQYSNIQFNALQVTFDTGARDVAILNSSGQITYNTPLRLWDLEYNYTTSFNTSFIINMGPTQDGGKNTSGGGMVFMLSSRNATDLPNSFEAWLGLVDGLGTQSTAINNSTTAANRFVAIEFDTFRDPGIDPNNSNHVGIDVDSVASVVSRDLDAYNITLNANVSNSGTNTSVWIDYDGHAKAFDIYLENGGSDPMGTKPKVAIVSNYRLELDQILPRNVFVGFSASTGTIKETHCVLEWHFRSTSFPNKSNSSKKALTLALSLSFTILLLIIASMIIFYIVRKRRVQPHLLHDIGHLSYGPRKFSYRELKQATRGFSQANKLGEGGFGAVYRGKLASMEAEIAVKRLSETSKQGVREFNAEIKCLGRMRHRNLVHLLGWSYDNWRGKLLLVYDYMPNGSLDRWLYPRGSHSHCRSMHPHPLSWKRRYNILRGVASGLLYLHEEWEMVVIHRDLKPSNIMLDADFNPRLGDFGLAKLIKNSNRNPNPDGYEQTTRTITIAGTYGYMAPECFEAGATTKECDVYSFGAVAMEVVTGMKLSAQNLHWLWKIKEEGGDLLSREFMEENDICYSFNGSLERKQMEMVLEMSLACCHPDPSCRPSVRQIVHDLNSSLHDDEDDGYADGDDPRSSSSAHVPQNNFVFAASSSTAYFPAMEASSTCARVMDSSMSDLSPTGR